MNISEKTNIHDLLENYPHLVSFLAERSSHYKNLKNPLIRGTIGRITTLAKVAEMSGESTTDLIGALKNEIHLRSREGFEAFIGKKYVDPVKKTRLKDIIIALHEGEDPERLKKQFAALAEETSTMEIADLEQSLINDGLPSYEVRRLCDLHMAIFEESLDAQQVPEMAEGHPIHTFMEENREAEKVIAKIKDLLGECGSPPNYSHMENMTNFFHHLLTSLQAISTHYARKEQLLFPLLDKHGVTGPTQIMRGIHDEIDILFKKALEDLDQNHFDDFSTGIQNIIGQVAAMIYQEEHILFPMALDVLSEDNWQSVRQGEESIGYAWITTPPMFKATPPEPATAETDKKTKTPEVFKMQTGTMTLEQINLVLTHLPVDISLVDENDKIVYFSDCPNRIFPRSPEVIGRAVQDSHPANSVGTVNRILDAFRKGDKHSAEFWINFGEKFVFIQYFALKDQQERYRGCLEVAQDVTNIRRLSGEKYMLEWE